VIFKRKPERDEEGFVATAVAEKDVGVDQLTRVFLEGKGILLTRLEGEIVAFAERCPHAAGKLDRIRAGQVRCPEHDYEFDLRTGRIVWPPDELYRLRRYAVAVRDKTIWIQIV
jgi:nitrite reductase/ring-hydroxylating ferredoxin subunit